MMDHPTGALSMARLMVREPRYEQDEGLMTQSRENFVRLAEARTTRVLKDLELLGNLSNKSNYSYGDEDVQKIFKAIQKRLRHTEGRFRTTLQQKAADQFKL
jgi:hypothetical protein